MDFVFFDGEEKGSIGAKHYIETVGSGNIISMINLDMCGFGSEILINDKGNFENPLFSRILSKEVLDRYKVQLIGFMPQGDDYLFEINNIPNISVCTADAEAKEFFAALADKIRTNQPIDENDQNQFMTLRLTKTMHGGEFDDISSINEEAVRMTAAYLLDGLMK